MQGITFKPLPEEEENALFDVLEDIYDNGGSIPEDPSPSLILLAVKQNYKQHKGTRNYVRGVEAQVRALGIVVMFIIVALVGHIGQEAGWFMLPFLP